MSKLRTIRGIIETFWQMTREDWYYLDRKLIKVVLSVVSFTVAALFWYFFLRNIMPF